jgi:hypothetical protein
MDNLFLKRATDFVRDDEAFVAMVSPEPIRHYLGKHAKQGALYDRLVVIRGTPGSGKTTLARLFDFPVINALLRNTGITGYKETVATLAECKAIQNGNPIVLGCHLNFEMDYRDFWNFQYADELKLGLMTTLVQARCILGWFQNVANAGFNLDNVEIVPRKTAVAGTDAIGGLTAKGLIARARSVEAAVYGVTGALVAPAEQDLPAESIAAYRPFDVIETISVTNEASELNLLPLVILDDAQFLHPQQYALFFRWLVRRDVRVARWLLTRLDVLQPQQVLTPPQEDSGIDLPGVTQSRDYIEIFLQSKGDERRKERTQFRKVAKDMATRYLRRMPLFAGRNLTSLADLLADRSEPLPLGKIRELEQRVLATKKRLGIPDARYTTLLAEVDGYRPDGCDLEQDVRFAILSILLHRYAKRTPHRSLFDEVEDPEPNKPLTVDSGIYDGARLHLLHEYDRAFYYGIDEVCDASSENAEQFLRLSAGLVDTLATQIIKGKSPSIDAKIQHKQLRETARDVIKKWDFPESDRVRALVDRIGWKCATASLEPNARLAAGANAYGVPQKQFEELSTTHPSLARVLHYAVAYNAITLVPNYPCKNQEWCLLELGGMVILNHKLTLKRGGFIEGNPDDLLKVMESPTI